MTAFRLPRTHRTSHTVALASLVAFATQVVFALLMLRLFTPEEVGEFSVLSQIGFFWMTLALAQAPLSLLANAHLPAELAARHAWRASVTRGIWLLPLVALALAFSKLNSWPALLWVLLLAVLIAISRVIVGAHFPSDVIAGAALGMACTFLLRRAFAARHIVFTRRGSLIEARGAGLVSSAWSGVFRTGVKR